MGDFTATLKPAHNGAGMLAAERARSTIPVEELSKHLLSRNDFLERQSRILKVLESQKLFSKKQIMNLSRPDRYHLGLARAKALRRLVVEHGWDEEDYRIAEYMVDEMSPFHLHTTMFMTTVREQADDAQRAYWMPRIKSWSIIGAYAQTELGHGSNVRGLECEARFDVATKEFVIHSPTLTASKWWNGSMGRTATHAIVVAQLLLPEGNESGKFVAHGPHPFIVQIRQEKTHQPFEGIVIGDIGPKYGYASMDNGYMLFNHYRVPHSAMLSRYSKVDPNTGSFKRTGSPALIYGSLTSVRANIVMHARLVLARAVTIAVRYCSIRRQFRDRDSKGDTAPEMVVLDYPTVQIRILPLLATTFALHYTGEAMYNLYSNTRKNIEKGDFSALAELHSTSSGLKSLCTTLAADSIETCRRAMGGHGFGGGSGLVELNADYLSKPTVEGDNWMITQQVASYLIKKMTNAAQDTDTAAVDATDKLFKEYIMKQGQHAPIDILRNNEINDESIVQAFWWRAADLSYKAYESRVKQKVRWTKLLIQLHKLSRVYSEAILVSNFYAALHTGVLSEPTSSVMKDLFRLYALYTMDADSRAFSTSHAVTNESLDRLSDVILHLMSEKVRPHAVRLVDGWAIPDYVLNSSLGRYDGLVYEDLFDLAHRHNPLNNITFNPDWRSAEIVLGSGDQGKIEAKL